MNSWYPLSKLIAPLFLEGEIHSQEYDQTHRSKDSLTNNNRYSPQTIAAQLEQLKKTGLKSFLIYPITPKDPTIPEHAQLERYLDPNNFLCKTIRECRSNHPDLLLMIDLCTCHFLASGQCGIQDGSGLSNQQTTEFYQRLAPLLAQSGAHALCVSSMMDGVIQTVRQSLDRSGYTDTLLVSQSAKLHSGYYGPFQHIGGGLKSQDLKKTYQIDPANASQMVREFELDQQEGADMAILKPVSLSLDIAPEITRRFSMPILGYTTGGEYLMTREALPLDPYERLIEINRYFSHMSSYGLSGMISYFAQEYAQLRDQLTIK